MIRRDRGLLVSGFSLTLFRNVVQVFDKKLLSVVEQSLNLG